MTDQEKIKFLVETADKIRRENNPHFDNPVEVRDVLWGDEAEDLKESILGSLRSPPMPREDDSLLMSMEKAMEIRDRLLNVFCRDFSILSISTLLYFNDANHLAILIVEVFFGGVVCQGDSQVFGFDCSVLATTSFTRNILQTAKTRKIPFNQLF